LSTHLTVRGRGLLLATSAACMIPTGVAGAEVSGGTSPGTNGNGNAAIGMAGAGKSQKVRYGKRVSIGGFVNPRAAGKRVRLEHAPRGRSFRAVSATTTRTDGSYRFSVKATRSGSFRASMGASPTATAARRVIVLARLAGKSRRHVLGAGAVGVRGRLLPRSSGRAVALQVRTRRGWKTVDRTRTRSSGRFKASFRPRGAGVYRLRVRFRGDRTAAAATDRLRRVYVYRAGHASWYGPGFYGNRTACGGALSAGRVGVAHKYLPCGTRVTFRHRGRSVTAPVIDRGPFAAGRDWDLTAAAKHKLGFGDVGVVWSTR
jgi:rare lipoprotein A